MFENDTVPWSLNWERSVFCRYQKSLEAEHSPGTPGCSPAPNTPSKTPVLWMTVTPVLSAQARPFLSPHLVKKQLKAPLLVRMTRFLLALCAPNWMFWKKQFKIPMLTVHHTQLLCFPTPCTLLSILAEPNMVQTYPSLDPSTKGVESIS